MQFFTGLYPLIYYTGNHTLYILSVLHNDQYITGTYMFDIKNKKRERKERKEKKGSREENKVERRMQKEMEEGMNGDLFSHADNSTMKQK